MAEKVLIIDDDPEFARVLGLMLKRRDYVPLTALGGMEGFNQAVREKPDVILLDLMMPDIDGYEVFRRIRLNPGTRSIPVIFVTAKSSEEDIARGLALGIQGYITKPFEREELYKAIRDALQEGFHPEGYDYLESLFDVVSAPILVWDDHLRIIRLNHAFERLTGYETGEIVGKDLRSLLPGSGRERLIEEIRDATLGKSWETLELPISCKDGLERFVLFSTANIYGVDGNSHLATVAQGQDITDRRVVEEELRKLNLELEDRVRIRTAELEEVNRELQAFTYSVSHDLRVPLSSINSFSNLVLRDHTAELSRDTVRILKVIRQYAQYAEELINALLRLSRVGRQDLEVSIIDMNELVEKVIAELETDVGDRNVEFVVGDLPTALGDRSLVQLVVSNLVGNSLKFTGPRERALVEVRGEEKGGRNVYCVKDNGVGFDMQFYDKLFKVFQRLHPDDEFEGTGLGLALVRRIIGRHGGEAWARSAPGEGAEFYFQLPSRDLAGETGVEEARFQ